MQNEKKSAKQNEQNLNNPNLVLQGDALQNQKANFLKSKFFWGFLGLSFLIAFIIGGIVLGKNGSNTKISQTLITTPTPTISETTNWKTYTAKTFSIKYPKDYQLNENKIVATEGIVEQQENTIQLISTPLPNTNGNLSIIIAYKPTKLYLEQAAKEGSTCAELSSKKLTPIKLGDNTFSQSGLINCGPNGVAFFYVLNNGNIYEAKVETTASYEKDALPVIKQILSTFKFTDSFTVTPTAEPTHSLGRYCTQEAKQCPDGSYVSRTGPNCEFAACP